LKLAFIHETWLGKCGNAITNDAIASVETTIAARHDTANIVFILTAIVAKTKKFSYSKE
jgi:hypothetical protein